MKKNLKKNNWQFNLVIFLGLCYVTTTKIAPTSTAMVKESDIDAYWYERLTDHLCQDDETKVCFEERKSKMYPVLSFPPYFFYQSLLLYLSL